MTPELIQSRYRILGKLGKGGMGTVFKAEDTHAGGKIIALKRIGLGDGGSDKLPYLRREFRILLQLHHPNLGEVFDFGEIPERLEWYFTSEYIEGIDLLEATRKMDWDEFLEAVVQICHALEYIHSRDIIHNDVKPRNIIVKGDRDRPPWLKLVDFGLSAEAAAASAGMIRGTVHYIAPEIIRGDAVDGRADIYSLGATLYHVITRRPPFVGDTNISVIRQHLHDEPIPADTLRKDLPKPIAVLLKHLMAKTPADRPQSANEVIREINRSAPRPFPLEPEEAAGTLLRSCFVGRSTELKILNRALTARGTREDEPTLVLVEGQAGMGKSRLIREFQVECQVQGIPFLHARSFEDTGRVYGSLGEIITQLLPVLESLELQREEKEGRPPILDRYRDDLARIVPPFAPEGGPALPPRAEEAKIAFFDRLARFFLEALSGTPAVIHISELHWAHSVTLEFLEYLANVASQERFLLLGSYRPEEVRERSVYRLLQRLTTSDFTRVIRLRGVDESDATLLVRSMLGTKEIPDGLIDLLLDTSGGNPLFLEEAMRELAEAGKLSYLAGRWTLRGDPRGTVAMPARFRDTLRRRVQKVTGPQREILNVLAALERPTSADWLARIAEFEPLILHSDLHTLERQGLIRRDVADGIPRFTFFHNLVRELVYEGMEEEERQKIHLAIAEFLQGGGTEPPPEHLEALAYHSKRTGSPETAIPFLVAAGDRSRELHAYEAALGFFREALSLAEGKDPDTSMKVTDGLSTVHRLLGQYDESMECLRLLVSLADERGEVRESSRAHLRLAEILRLRGEIGKARDHAETALEGFRKKGDPREVALALNTRGSILWSAGEEQAAIECFEDCLAEHQSPDEALEVGTALRQLGVIHQQRGELTRALQCHEGALDLSEKAGDDPGTADTLEHIGMIRQAQGDHDKALECHGRSLAIRREIGDPLDVATSLNHMGRVHSARGEYPLALAACAEALRIGGRLRHRRRIAGALASLARVHMALADIPLASHLQGQALALCREEEDRRLEGSLLCDAGLLRLMNEDLIEARALLLQAQEIGQEAGDTETAGLAQFGLGRVAVLENRPDEAAPAASRIIQHGRTIQSPRLMALGLLLRGEVALRLNRTGDAMNDLREAVKVVRDLKDPDLLWQACHLGGLAADRRGDADGAARLFSAALVCIEEVAGGLEDPEREPYLSDRRKWRFREDALALKLSFRGPPT